MPQRLPATLIFDYPNLEAIALYLGSLLEVLDSEDSPERLADEDRAAQEDEERAAQERRSAVEELSDEEVEQMLLRKLEDDSTE